MTRTKQLYNYRQTAVRVAGTLTVREPGYRTITSSTHKEEEEERGGKEENRGKGGGEGDQATRREGWGGAAGTLLDSPQRSQEMRRGWAPLPTAFPGRAVAAAVGPEKRVRQCRGKEPRAKCPRVSAGQWSRPCLHTGAGPQQAHEAAAPFAIRTTGRAGRREARRWCPGSCSQHLPFHPPSSSRPQKCMCTNRKSHSNLSASRYECAFK